MSLDTLVNLALFGAAIVLMLRFGCGRHMVGHSHGRGHGGAQSNGPSSAARSDIDPVCGMTVGWDSEHTVAFEGRVYRFCSETCRNTFEASPATYVSQVAAQSRTDHRHSCCHG